VVLGLAACGGSDDSAATATEPATTSTTTATNTTTPTKTTIRAPKGNPVLVPPKGPPPEKMAIEDLRAGNGPRAEAGDKLTAEYTGFNYVNHEEFTNHAHAWGRGEPLVFELGGGEVIRGIDQGLVGMKVGGRRELIIPPDLAYGNVSPPPEVGPNETVIYVVELLGIG
jgi:peptidylprolyl isomerase